MLLPYYVNKSTLDLSIWVCFLLDRFLYLWKWKVVLIFIDSLFRKKMLIMRVYLCNDNKNSYYFIMLCFVDKYLCIVPYNNSKIFLSFYSIVLRERITNSFLLWIKFIHFLDLLFRLITFPIIFKTSGWMYFYTFQNKFEGHLWMVKKQT